MHIARIIGPQDLRFFLFEIRPYLCTFNSFTSRKLIQRMKQVSVSIPTFIYYYSTIFFSFGIRCIIKKKIAHNWNNNLQTLQEDDERPKQRLYNLRVYSRKEDPPLLSFYPFSGVDLH